MLHKSTKIIIALSASVIFIIGLFLAITTALNHANVEIYVFEDISECQALETLDKVDGAFIRYQDTAKDKHLADLEFTSYFAGEYSCKQYHFQIFAYEFCDVSNAKEYFNNVAGKNTDELNRNFSLSSGIINSELVVLYDARAYRVHFPTNNLLEITQILEDIFSLKMS